MSDAVAMAVQVVNRLAEDGVSAWWIKVSDRGGEFDMADPYRPTQRLKFKTKGPTQEDYDRTRRDMLRASMVKR